VDGSAKKQTNLDESLESKTNPFTHKKYSSKYFQIMEKRKLLPAWEARSKLIELVSDY